MPLLSKLVGMWNYDFFTVTKIDMKRQQTFKKKAFVHVLILKISVTKMLLLIRFVLLRKNESHLWKQSWTLIITGIHLYSTPNLNIPITDKGGSPAFSSYFIDFTSTKQARFYLVLCPKDQIDFKTLLHLEEKVFSLWKWEMNTIGHYVHLAIFIDILI